jgi:hypothetical protein
LAVMVLKNCGLSRLMKAEALNGKNALVEVSAKKHNALFSHLTVVTFFMVARVRQMVMSAVITDRMIRGW